MFAYLKNYLGQEQAPTVDAVLVYPLTDRPLDLSYTFHGHGLRVYTIDLNQHWRLIRRDLLALVAARGIQSECSIETY
jgi:5-methylcytosine-specific restriction enzyme subunit McrC